MRDSRFWDDAVLGVFCTQCLLMIMAWRDREGCLNLMFLGDGRVDNEKEREIRGDRGNHREEQGLLGISCASHFTSPDTAGTSLDPARNNTYSRSSKPNQASHTLDFSYPLVSTTSFSSSLLISLFLIHNSVIIAEHTVKSSFCISACHDQELTPSCSIHRAQHTPSTE